MSQSPANKLPWLHWPPTREEKGQAVSLLAVIALLCTFVIACAALGTTPMTAIGNVLGVILLFIGVLMFCFLIVGALFFP